MSNVIDFKEKKDQKDERSFDALTDFDSLFKSLSSNELNNIILKTKNHLKSVGYKPSSSDKSVDKKKFQPKKTILFRELNIGFSLSTKNKFTDDLWVIYPIEVKSGNSFIELVNFIQLKIEVSKDVSTEQSKRS